MKLSTKLLAFLALIFMPCAHGYIVRQTVMERQHEDGFTERLIIFHDYHKADAAVSIEQSKALVALFAQIQAQDSSAELFLEQPELSDVTRKVNRFLATMAERSEAMLAPLAGVKFETIKKNGASLMAGMQGAFPAITARDVGYLLPLIGESIATLRTIPGIGGKQEDQLLVQLGKAFEGFNNVRYLDNRVGVTSLVSSLLVLAFLYPIFFDTSLYNYSVELAKNLDLSLHHVFSYINVFLDETIERCDHAQLFFTACPADVRRGIDLLKDRCTEVKRTIASRLQELMQDGMYKVSIADFLANVTQCVHGNAGVLPAVVERYKNAAEYYPCALDTYMQATFMDRYLELLRLLLPVPNRFSLYDAWLASELIRSSAKTVVIVTGALHGETLMELLRINGYEILYDSLLHLSNGMRISGFTSFGGSDHVGIPVMPHAWCPVFSAFALQHKTAEQLIQELYRLASLGSAQAVAAQRYTSLIDIKPYDVALFKNALLPAEELAALQNICPYDQHYVLRAAWHIED